MENTNETVGAILERHRVPVSMHGRLWASLVDEGWTHEYATHPEGRQQFDADVGRMWRLLRAVDDHEYRRRVARKLAVWEREALRRADAAAEAVKGKAEDVRRAAGVDILKPEAIAPWVSRLLKKRRRTPQSRVLLAYAAGGSVQPVNVAGVPVLERIAQVADELADEHGWQAHQATALLLAGQTPIVWPVTAKRSYRMGESGTRLVAIELTVAPWVPGRAVADAFRRQVQRTTAAEGAALRRTARPDRAAKLETLRAFLDARPGCTHGGATMAVWNEERPHWRYQRRTTFSRDCGAAMARPSRRAEGAR